MKKYQLFYFFTLPQTVLNKHSQILYLYGEICIKCLISTDLHILWFQIFLLHLPHQNIKQVKYERDN